jgi:hypothetical protein
MDTASPANRRVSAARRVARSLLATIRHGLGRIFQLLFRDQLRELNRQTERLGAASVESATYLGVELEALDRRLSRIEADVAGLREAVTPDKTRR